MDLVRLGVALGETPSAHSISSARARSVGAGDESKEQLDRSAEAEEEDTCNNAFSIEMTLCGWPSWSDGNACAACEWAERNASTFHAVLVHRRSASSVYLFICTYFISFIFFSPSRCDANNIFITPNVKRQAKRMRGREIASNSPEKSTECRRRREWSRSKRANVWVVEMCVVHKNRLDSLPFSNFHFRRWCKITKVKNRVQHSEHFLDLFNFPLGLRCPSSFHTSRRYVPLLYWTVSAFCLLVVERGAFVCFACHTIAAALHYTSVEPWWAPPAHVIARKSSIGMNEWMSGYRCVLGQSLLAYGGNAADLVMEQVIICWNAAEIHFSIRRISLFWQRFVAANGNRSLRMIYLLCMPLKVNVNQSKRSYS